jgi:transposase-like protein
MQDRRYVRYSSAFKQKVISEIESGHLTLAQAKRIYDIKGGDTVQQWLRKYGKSHLLPNVIRVAMKDEKDKLKELEREKQKLESALANAHLKIVSLEALLESAEEHYDIDFKKNFGYTASTKLSTTKKKKK